MRLPDIEKKKLLVGERVEVRQQEDGLRGSWHLGTVIRVRKSFRDVQYDELLADDKVSKLVEEIKVNGKIEGWASVRMAGTPRCQNRGIIRPLPPSIDNTVMQWKYGLCVDALYDDAWWEGILVDDNEGAEERAVFFPDEGDEQRISVNKLRLSQSWDELKGSWSIQGNWTLATLRDVFMKEGMHIKEVWYYLRQRSEFLRKIVDWIHGEHDLWLSLVNEVIVDRRGKRKNKLFICSPSNSSALPDRSNRGSTDSSMVQSSPVQAATSNAGSFLDSNRKEDQEMAPENLLHYSIENGGNTTNEGYQVSEMDTVTEKQVKDKSMCHATASIDKSLRLISASISLVPTEDRSNEEIDKERTCKRKCDYSKEGNSHHGSLGNELILFGDGSLVDREDEGKVEQESNESPLVLTYQETKALQEYQFHSHLFLRNFNNNSATGLDLFKTPRNPMDCDELCVVSLESDAVQKADNSCTDIRAPNAAFKDTSLNIETEISYDMTLLEALKSVNLQGKDLKAVSEVTYRNGRFLAISKHRSLLNGPEENLDEMKQRIESLNLLSVGWALKFKRQGGTITSYYASPTGQHYYSLRKACSVAGIEKKIHNALPQCHEEGLKTTEHDESPITGVTTSLSLKKPEANGVIGYEVTNPFVESGKILRLSMVDKDVNNSGKSPEWTFRGGESSKACKSQLNDGIMQEEQTAIDENHLEKKYQVTGDKSDTGSFNEKSHIVESKEYPPISVCGGRKRKVHFENLSEHKKQKYETRRLNDSIKKCRAKEDDSSDLRCTSRKRKHASERLVENKKQKLGMLKKNVTTSTNGYRMQVRPASSLFEESREQGTSVSGNGKRAVRSILSWMIEKGAVEHNQRVFYRSKKENFSLQKEGRITSKGIYCVCCKEVYSLTSFEAHAGSKLHRPSANIFLEDGKSLLQCQIELWEKTGSKGYKVVLPKRKKKKEIKVESDDFCSVCRQGGSLILCDGCPSSFHIECIQMKVVPPGEWYCPYCRRRSCGHSIAVEDHAQSSNTSNILFCDQCECHFHEHCGHESLKEELEASEGNWFCSKNCYEVFSKLRNAVGKMYHIGDGFSWSILRSNEDSANNDSSNFEDAAELHSKLCVSMSVMHECFEPIIEPRLKKDMIPELIFNRGSDKHHVNFRGFYTVVLEKGDDLITVATIRIRGKRFAEMPLVGTRFDYRRKGMCRLLLNELEKFLGSVGVERLILPAVAELKPTWENGFGFQEMSSEDISKYHDFDFVRFPDTHMLQKSLINENVAEGDRQHQFFELNLEKQKDFDNYRCMNGDIASCSSDGCGFSALGDRVEQENCISGREKHLPKFHQAHPVSENFYNTSCSPSNGDADGDEVVVVATTRSNRMVKQVRRKVAYSCRSNDSKYSEKHGSENKSAQKSKSNRRVKIEDLNPEDLQANEITEVGDITTEPPISDLQRARKGDFMERRMIDHNIIDNINHEEGTTSHNYSLQCNEFEMPEARTRVESRYTKSGPSAQCDQHDIFQRREGNGNRGIAADPGSCGGLRKIRFPSDITEHRLHCLMEEDCNNSLGKSSCPEIKFVYRRRVPGKLNGLLRKVVQYWQRGR